VSPLELFAALLGAISVWLVVQRNVWAFPIGIVMVVLYAWIFYEAKLYSDMLLQVFFVLMQVQGWIDWSRSSKASDDKIVVRTFTPAHWLWVLVVQGLGTLALGYTMHHFTDAAMPWPDAFATVMSISAQWWMNKRFLQNWILWIAVDFLYLFIYFAKGLYATTVLYFVFLLMAVAGYLEWRRKVGGT
jgi:nicotinamide mononucleotide transporter